MRQFLRDIQDIRKTKKFWVGVGGAVLLFLSENYADRAWVQTLIGLGTLAGIYQFKNED